MRALLRDTRDTLWDSLELENDLERILSDDLPKQPSVKSRLIYAVLRRRRKVKGPTTRNWLDYCVTRKSESFELLHFPGGTVADIFTIL